MRVTIGCQNFKNAIINGQDRDIKSTTTQIKDENVEFTSLFVKTVRNGSSRGFIDDTSDSKPGNSACILGSLSLSIVEVGGDRDDCE